MDHCGRRRVPRLLKFWWRRYAVAGLILVEQPRYPGMTFVYSQTDYARYDVTKFAGVHPGGTNILLEYAGKAPNFTKVSQHQHIWLCMYACMHACMHVYKIRSRVFCRSRVSKVWDEGSSGFLDHPDLDCVKRLLVGGYRVLREGCDGGLLWTSSR